MDTQELKGRCLQHRQAGMSLRKVKQLSGMSKFSSLLSIQVLSCYQYDVYSPLFHRFLVSKIQ